MGASFETRGFIGYILGGYWIVCTPRGVKLNVSFFAAAVSFRESRAEKGQQQQFPCFKETVFRNKLQPGLLNAVIVKLAKTYEFLMKS